MFVLAIPYREFAAEVHILRTPYRESPTMLASGLLQPMGASCLVGSNDTIDQWFHVKPLREEEDCHQPPSSRGSGKRPYAELLLGAPYAARILHDRSRTPEVQHYRSLSYRSRHSTTIRCLTVQGLACIIAKRRMEWWMFHVKPTAIARLADTCRTGFDSAGIGVICRGIRILARQPWSTVGYGRPGSSLTGTPTTDFTLSCAP